MPAPAGVVDVRPAVKALLAGQCVCFPTETVWALAAPALVPEAVQEVFRLKQRPEGVPLALGFHSWRSAQSAIVATPLADRLAAKFMPGPVSLVVKRRDPELAHVAPGFDTLSIRVPDHDVARRILDATDPLVMTSANLHGEADPITADEVRAMFPDLLVMDGVVPGTASTVVDATGDTAAILRAGAITAEQIAEA